MFKHVFDQADTLKSDGYTDRQVEEQRETDRSLMGKKYLTGKPSKTGNYLKTHEHF